MKRRGWLAVIGVPLALVCAAAAWWLVGSRPVAADPPALTNRDGIDADVCSLIDQELNSARANPRSAAHRSRLAMAYHANGLLEPAVACYEQALALDDSIAPTWYHLALARAELGDLAGALDAAAKAASLDSTYSPLQWRMGLWLMDLQRLDEAEAVFGRALRINPADVGGSIGLARLSLQKGDANRAVQILQDVLKRTPNNASARRLLGSAYYSLHKANEARAELARAGLAGSSEQDPWRDEVRKLRRGYKPIIEDAQRLVSMGRGAEAVSSLETLRRSRPDDVPLLLTLSVVYQQANQIDRAMDTMQDALTRNPSHFAVHLNIANLYMLKGRTDLALAHVNKSIELNPWQGRAYSLKGEILARSGKTDEAIESLRQAQKLGGQDFDTAILLASLQADRGKLDDAMASFQQAQRINPDEPRLAALAKRLQQIQNGAPNPPR